MGTCTVIVARASCLRQSVATKGSKDILAVGLKECVAALESMTAESATEMKAAGCEFYRTVLELGQLIWIPSGFLVGCRMHDNPLNYAIRKSIFHLSGSAKQDVASIVEMRAVDGEDAGRLKQVADLYP
jgi:hypothetical protein